MEDTTQKNVFITDDIHLDDWDSDASDYERYEYTEDLEDCLQHIADYCDEATPEEKEQAQKLYDGFPANYYEAKEWIDEHQSLYDDWRDNADEPYIMPMMYALRYYPSFVSFDEEDRYKCNGSTCLVYDNDREAWAVGMSGGGMDLGPHLLATFVKLGKGVPAELASSIRRDYNAYVRKEEHEENCKLLARAYINEGLRGFKNAERLDPEAVTDTMKRHIQGIEKELA